MIEQTIIAICGMASIIGLVAQPFWMYATFKAAQWGIFALSFVYAAGWARGVRHHWFR